MMIKKWLRGNSRAAILGLLALVLLPVLAHAQNNSVSGIVYSAVGRQPIEDIYIELTDEFRRTVQRVRTDTGGRYQFTRIAQGTYYLKVLSSGTGFIPVEIMIEFQNVTRTNGDGGTTAGAPESKDEDIYLKLRPDAATGGGAIFAQDIPEEARKLFDAAVKDLGNKKDKEGLAGLKAALEIFPTYYNALDRLGREYVRINRCDAASVLLGMAVNVNPKGGRSWYGLAYCQYNGKDLDNALKSATKTVEVDPYMADAFLLLGTIERLKNKNEDSEAHLAKARELSSDSMPDAHWQLALLYANNMKKYREAAKELKLFLKAQPNTKDLESINKLIAEFEAKAKGS